MMTNDDERGEGGEKCPKFDDVICERPLTGRREGGCRRSEKGGGSIAGFPARY